MTIPQAIKHLRVKGFHNAADSLKAVYEQALAAKAEKGPKYDWPCSEACGIWSEATGAVIDGKLSRKIGETLDPLVKRAASKYGISEGDAWKRQKPFWEAYARSRDSKCGPGHFASAPGSWRPEASPATVGAPLPSVTRPPQEQLEATRRAIFERVGK